MSRPRPLRRLERQGVRVTSVALTGLLLLLGVASSCRKTGGVAGLRLDATAGIGGFGNRNASGSSGGSVASRGGAPGGGGDNPPSSGGAGDANLAGAAGSDPGLSVASPREALLGAIAECTLGEARALVVDADALVGATEAHRASVSAGSIEAVRAAWLRIVGRWQRLELFQFGPLGDSARAGGQGLRANFSAWPSFNRCFIDQQTESRYYDDPGFPEALPNTRGLGAIEYLAFYAALDNGCAASHRLNQSGAWAALGEAEIATRRAAYAHAAALDVRERARALVTAWDPAGGNFSRELTTAGSGSSVYPSLQAGFNAVSDAMFYLDTQVKDMKLAWPLGIGDCAGPCPSIAESPFAGRSKEHVHDNLLGFRMLYQGCGARGRGIGFDDVLVELDQPALAERMREEIDAAIAAIGAIEEPGIEAAMIADPASVDAAYLAVKAVTDSLKTEFLAVLDLARPMGAEGDND